MPTNETDFALMPVDQALDLLAKEVPALRSEVRLASRSWRFVGVVLVIAIATGATLFVRQNQAQEQRVADQHRQDIAACSRSNESRQQIAVAFDGVRKALTSASDRPGQSLTPERQAVLDKFNGDIDRIVAQFGPRDCSKLYPKP